MAHDPTKALMGSPGSSAKQGSEVFASDPATFLAGLAVRRKNSATIPLSVTKADGAWVGISLGASLSDCKKTSVLKTGELVPVLLEAAPARGVVVITDYANLVLVSNDTLKVGATTFTFKTSASSSTEVLCAASGSSNAVVAAALAAKINAHTTAGALFKAVVTDTAEVTITAKTNSTLGSTIDLVYTDAGVSDIGLTVDDVTFTGGGIDPDYVVIGANVYFSDVTGKADDPSSGATVSNAIYMSEPLTGIAEDGSEVYCALIDYDGGL